MTAEKYNKYLKEEIKRVENIEKGAKAYAILEMTIDIMSQMAELPKLPREFLLTTLIFSSNPLINRFSPEVQKEIRILYYMKIGSFLGRMSELGESYDGKS